MAHNAISSYIFFDEGCSYMVNCCLWYADDNTGNGSRYDIGVNGQGHILLILSRIVAYGV